MNQKIIKIVFPAVAVLASILAVGNYVQVQKLKEDFAVTKTALNAKTLISENQQVFDDYVSDQIDEYVEKQKRERVDSKYVAYKSAEDKPAEGKHIYGNLDARFTLVEFSDLECGYCQKFHTTPKQVVDVSNGQVNWQWKHFPLNRHVPAAFREAHATECAASVGGNKAFWVFIHSIFEQTKGGGKGAGSMTDIATGIGLDKDKFNQCMIDGLHREKIIQDMQKGESMGVGSTPVTFVVDNQTGQHFEVRGLQSAEAIIKVIDQMKKASAQTQNDKSLMRENEAS